MNRRAIGAGPAVVLLHGIPTCGRLWDDVLERLQSRFTCIAVDLPGFGGSPALANGSRDPVRYAGEVERLRIELQISSWHVIGHDAGAAIAVHYAVGFPERVDRLVLCSPPVFPDFRVPWFFRLMRTPVVGDAVAPLMSLAIWRAGIFRASRRRDPAFRAIVDACHRPFRGWRGVRRFVRLLRWGEPREVLARTAGALSAIDAPTLVLHGRHDGAVPAAFASRAAAIVRNAELAFFDCGHFVPLDAPDAFCARVLQFLDGGASDHAPAVDAASSSARASRRSVVSNPSVNPL